MLGVVSADDAITLFVFWELTTITSWLLIGFDHERAAARAAALQALLVTGLRRAGAARRAAADRPGRRRLRLSAMNEHRRRSTPARSTWRSSGWCWPAPSPSRRSCRSTSGCRTRWRRRRRSSAYLHSATMVKAGVYLVARLHPVLGGTAALALAIAGRRSAASPCSPARSGRCAQTDLKLLLAYYDGERARPLMMLLGIGTALAAQAAMTLPASSTPSTRARSS